MTALPALTELLARLGAELDFDVARSVECVHGPVDVVWFDRCLPLAAVVSDPIDLAEAPVLPVIAFAARTAAMFEAADLAMVLAGLEASGAPLGIVVIGRDSRQAALAPAVQSIEQLRKQDDDLALRRRIAESLRAHPRSHGRTIAMSQDELVEWARRLREVRPRSYSAESLFNRTGAID